jgi:hypothetical protein
VKGYVKYISLIAIVIAILTGCSVEKEIPETTTSTYVPLEIALGLQRTMCYGSCPSFAFEVLNDGRASLTVGRFTEEVIGRHLDEGDYKCTISHIEIDQITTYAEANGYLKLNDRYDDKRVMDLPVAISTINGKTVFNRYNGPDLDELYSKIEELMSKANWIAEPDTQK